LKTIAICSPSFCKNEILRALALKTAAPHHKVIFSTKATELQGDDLRQFLSTADFALIGKEYITRDLLIQVPHLKAIAKYGVGLDSIDLTACKELGVRVYCQAGVNADSVAEYTVGLMLATFRNIARSDRKFHQGVWWKDGGIQLSGKTIGIVGFGAIGSKVAKLLKAFSCSILVTEVDEQKHDSIRANQFKIVSLDDLLMLSDVVSLHVPLIPTTARLLDANRLSLMKPKSILINTSRGKIVDENALKIALRNGKLAGAGLDVFEEEPASDPELFKIETLVATAHMAGNSEEAILSMGRAAIDGMQEFLFNGIH
jgi:D-3-phosphoglycerate dehydrogenase